METENEINAKPFRFMDEDEESDDDEPVVKTDTHKSNQIKKVSNVKKILDNPREKIDYIFADANNYSFKTWKNAFPDNKVVLRSLIFNSAWDDFFDIVEKKTYYAGMERILSDIVAKNESTIVPFAELVFNSLNVLSPHMIKAVLIGQDPYINSTKINEKHVPQAMGFSFSVPLNYPKPPSLNNIYNNLITFNHLKKIPEGGCLAGWIMQGIFPINASFTTLFRNSNAHKDIWKDFTKDLLIYINGKCDNLVFLAWGKDAHTLCLNIDPKKHHIITSSHPSPFAFKNTYTGYEYGIGKTNRKAVTYPSFDSTDHFGRMNNYLASVGKKEIFLDLIDF